ncbi:hypothetical protein ACJJTC_007795 [Scirpophaga incertulas]
MTISQQEGPADYESSEVAPRGGRDVTTVNRSHRGGGHDAARRGTPRVFFSFLLHRYIRNILYSQSSIHCKIRARSKFKNARAAKDEGRNAQAARLLLSEKR